MAIARSVHRWTCIVPVRFTRAPHPEDPEATSGAPDGNAPDPDDRGFVPAAEGCAVLCAGVDRRVAFESRPETRVKLVRAAVENTAPLYITCDNHAVLELTSPAAGAPLPGEQKAIVKFRVKDAGECFLEVRFGSRDGPVIHRLKVVTLAVRNVPVRVHVPTINGTVVNDSSGNPVPARSVRTDAEIRNMIAQANRIYFHYGLRFRINGAIDRAGVLNLTNRGMVNDQTAEFNQVTALNRADHMINMYFVPQIGAAAEVDQVGGSATSARTSPATFGSLIADMTTRGQTIAHELGHVLNLVNDPSPTPMIHVNTRLDPAIPGTGRDIRNDIVSRRRLMWAYTDFGASAGMPYRNNVGYGANRPGGMLTYRALASDPTDQEVQEVRRTAGRI